MHPRHLAQGTPPMPWWRIRMMWLVLGGPTVVVVASIATLVIAIRNPDPIVSAPAARSLAEAPAVQARNHAATGTLPNRP
jgi:uncharacterized protein